MKEAPQLIETKRLPRAWYCSSCSPRSWWYCRRTYACRSSAEFWGSMDSCSGLTEDTNFLVFSVSSQDGPVGPLRPHDFVFERFATSARSLCFGVCFQEMGALPLQSGVWSSQHEAKFLIRDVPPRGICEIGVVARWEDIVWRYWECVLHEKEARVDKGGYAILESSVDQMRFSKKLLEIVGLYENHKRMSLRAFTASVHSRLPGEQALKVASNRTH